MNRLLVIAVVTLIAGCASTEEDENVVTQNDVIDDFIEVSELEPLRSIRTSDHQRHEILTDEYIVISERRGAWLVKFANRCPDIYHNTPRPDLRYDHKRIRVKIDTIRGCRIAEIYEINDAMMEELDGLMKPYE